MISLVISAILVGVFISLVLIGPVFFLLIETSLTKGVKPAIALEAGVITADLLCIVISHFGSRDMFLYIDRHPSVFIIGGFIIFVYGLFNVLSKGNLHIKGGTNIASTNYYKTFINGFLLNLVNIGVIVFWLTTVVFISSQYPKISDFYLYMIVMMITIVGVDLLKIFLANKFQSKLTDRLVYRIKRLVGIVLIVFGIVICCKSLLKKGKTNDNNPIEFIEKNKKFK